MSDSIVTFKNYDKTQNLLPRTKIQAISDSNGNYLDSELSAGDINQLKGKTVLTTNSQAVNGNIGKYDSNGKLIDSGIPAARVAPLAGALSVVNGALCITYQES